MFENTEEYLNDLSPNYQFDLRPEYKLKVRKRWAASTRRALPALRALGLSCARKYARRRDSRAVCTAGGGLLGPSAATPSLTNSGATSPAPQDAHRHRGGQLRAQLGALRDRREGGVKARPPTVEGAALRLAHNLLGRELPFLERAETPRLRGTPPPRRCLAAAASAAERRPPAAPAPSLRSSARLSSPLRRTT